MKKCLALMLLLSLVAAPAHGAPTQPARNKDGSIVTGVLTPAFDPSNGVLPFPHNLLFTGTTDLTLNPPVDDPTDLSDPAVALSALDGFSTTERWVASFVDNARNAGQVDPASVVPGHSVRVFKVATQQFLAVTGIIRELTPGVDYTAVGVGSNVAIIPLRPLDEYSSYMAVLTNDITDVAGNNATPDQTYFLTKRRTPWVDQNGQSVYPLLGDATARTLEPLRQITQSMELNAAAFGVNPDDIVLSWTVQTQSISRTLLMLRSIAEPAPVTLAPTGLTTAAVGGLGRADIVIGVITLPYYGGIPTPENPIAPLTEIWRAEPGAYVPPFDQFGLNPNSRNITIANPFPVPTGMQTVPVMLTVPNASSGFTKPEGGWPVVIYQHGITRNRTDVLVVADALASTGHAVIAIDQPLHGVVPAVAPQLAPFFIENTPFGPIANERTFNADYFDNVTGAPGPDGIPDPSGTSSFNLANLLAVRDNLRQHEADMSILALSLQNMSVDGDSEPDLRPFDIGLISHSLGVTVSLPFIGAEQAITLPAGVADPLVSRAYLNAAPGQGIRTILAGAFGDRIRAGLAAAGVLPGTPAFEQFVIVAQTVIDPADGINWAARAVSAVPIAHNQVIGDMTVPNAVPGAPLAGSEALNRLMGLTAYDSTLANPDGLAAVARFVQPASHSSILQPVVPAVTAEMHGQMASFLASGGTFIQVGDPALLVPVVPGQALQEVTVSKEIADLKHKSANGRKPIFKKALD